MKEYYRVQANIDLSAIRQNVINAKKLLTDNTKMMAIVKADAYGHGAVEVAGEINDLVDAYGVAILEEGIELRQAGFTKPILILGFTSEPQYKAMIDFDIATAVFQKDMAEKMSAIAVDMGKKARVHIKLDTGMSRIGFALNDKSLDDIVAIAQLPGIQIDGCFSHFARMDEVDKTKAKKQFQLFCDFVKRIEDAGVTLPIKHISNSAGIIEAPEVNLDMVRNGISLYGLYPSEEVNKDKLDLTPAMELKARVSYVKELEAGVEIGYGGTYTTTRRTKVATIPVGYADGYPRSLSNRGRVLIHGQSAPIIGRVCMDQFMVDVTDINQVEEGDIVTLFGKDGEEQISIEEISEMAYSFNYEFVCDVGKRVPRVFLRDGKKIGTRDYYPEY
ncbi:MAG: alanine racemase [Butyribacter sp.]|nr:alanine racemase [bacterium]MDY3855209.1 alanine racemase [Butyribacter sp.]